MKKKKVLLVVNYYFPYVSGVSEYARSVANALSHEYDVTVLTGKHRSELPDHETVDGYSIVRAKPLFFIDKGYISPAFISKFITLAREADCINLHLPMLESGLLSILTSKPLLTTYQCDMALVGSPLGKFAVRCVRASMRLALARAKIVAVLSNDYAASSPLARNYLDKTVEISPPNRFEGEGLALETVRNKDHFVCGFVGRFVLEKGIDSIVRAASLLKNQNIEFWLAGDYKEVAGGSIFPLLESEIQGLAPKVRLMGRLSDEELKDFYRRIDVLLLPSTNRFEAFGMVQMEAMTFGASVVTSDMPGVRDTVRKTGIGKLCIPESPESLALAIQSLRSEVDQLTRSERSAIVCEKFSLSKFNATYVNIVRNITGYIGAP